MTRTGENPSDLASRLPAGSYVVREPFERSGLIFARVQHRTDRMPFEGGITPAADILSLHRTSFEGQAWRNGRLIHEGSIAARSLSLVKAGDQSVVRLSGDLDIVQVFLPRESIGALAAEVTGRPVNLAIDGWITETFIEDLVGRTLAAVEAGGPETRLETETLALRLAEHLVRHHSGPDSVKDGGALRFGGLGPVPLRRVLDFMEANLQREILLADLAAQTHLTPYHFLRSFHVETGLTPHQWLIRRRIARAKSLLTDSNLSIAEIAGAVGYASQSAMTATFSRVVGISPKQWRMKRH